MPSVTSTVTVTADDGSSTTTTITETATGEAAFPISPSLSPSMGFGGVMTTFPIDGPVDKAAPLVAQFRIDDSETFGALGEWKWDGDGSVGSFRTVELPGPVAVTEMCTNVTETGYSYAVVKGGDAMGLYNYRGTFQCVPASETTSLLVWSVSFQSNDVPAAEALLKGFYPVMEGLAAEIGAKCK